MKNKLAEENNYKLWREYLKRSSKYEKFCQLINKGYLSDKTSAANRGLTATDKKIIYDSDLMKTWEFFGDVFNQEFKDWWPPAIPEKPKVVVELADAIEKPGILLRMHMLQCRRKNGRNLTIDELAKIPDPEYVYLRLRLIDNLQTDVIARDIISLKKKKQGIIENIFGLTSSNIYSRYYRPTGKVYYEQLKDYLAVYDLKKELTWNKVMERYPIKRISTKEQSDRKRTYKLYKENAIKIIRNVEHGYFPGDYK